jgi:hypothetical protein
MYLFISYSRADAAAVDELSALLTGLKIPHFLDRKDITWGLRIRKEVKQALGRATHVIVVISASSLKSGWVSYELGIASGVEIARRRRLPILPWVLNPELTLPDYLYGIQHLMLCPGNSLA